MDKKAQDGVVPGAEVFLQHDLGLVENKKVGMLTNAAGVDRDQNSLVELFYENPDIDLVALFGPEHGLNASAQAGEYVPMTRDKNYDIPIYSLYGQDLEFGPGSISDLDESMRSFDTQNKGKFPELVMLKGLDAMIFDLQDVGTRVYTYAATMAYCMQACGESGIDFIVLDRPNPLNGIDMEGPILEYPKFSSFVGLYPIPMRHAMTMGELALFIQDNFLKNKVRLQVIPMEGWQRKMWFDDTSLPWVPPSPNIPTLNTAMVYPGQVLWEGTNVSEGRGTSVPFEVFGAPWIEGYNLKFRLDELDLPGVKIQESGFTPAFSKYEGEFCGGCRLLVTDRDAFKPLLTTLNIISVVKDLYSDKLYFHSDYFDTVMGTNRVRQKIEQGKKNCDVINTFDDEIREFSEIRNPYLLYV